MTSFYCKILKTEVLLEDCPDCTEYASCKEIKKVAKLSNGKFTDSDRRHVQKELDGHNKEAVAGFINDLEHLCALHTEFFPSFDITANRKELKKMLGRIKKTTNDLELLINRKVHFEDEPQNMQKLIKYSEGIIQTEHERWKLINDAWEKLSFVAILIEETLKERHSGRPTAEQDQFVEEIKKAYKYHIGSHSTYKDGSFYNIVRIALRATGKNIKDPTRHISPTKSTKKS